MSDVILGLPGNVFLLWLSASFYVLVILILFRPLKQIKNELILAFNAFLYGMAIFHIFLGAGIFLNNTVLIHFGIFAALTGSAFTLKFPLSSFNNLWQNIGFYTALAAAWVIVLWALLFSIPTDLILKITLAYMIIVTGGAGFYTIFVGIKSSDPAVKVKCIGGGLGMVTCCFFADLLVFFKGVTMFGEFLMSIAPLIVLAGLFFGRRLQKDNSSPVPGDLINGPSKLPNAETSPAPTST